MKDSKGIDRREFLFRLGGTLVGSTFALTQFSTSHALQKTENGAFFQPKIALIIDDIGYSLHSARRFLNLDAPMTFSILPGLDNTHYLANEIHTLGHEIMLHQPMEPYNADIDPGPGALYVGDETSRIFQVLKRNISDVPFAIGVNNHMGSKFTSCRNEMKHALEVIKEKDLFFVDSVTTSRSCAYETAKNLGVTTAFRNTFLDTQPDETAILSQLNRLKRHALKYGRAIGIGHPYPQTARALEQFCEGLSADAISLVPISEILYA